MNRILLSFFLLLFLVLAFSQQRPGIHTNREYLKEYVAADHFYHKAQQLPGHTDKTAEKKTTINREALTGFKKLLPLIEKAGDDSLAFYCYYKIAVLEHYFDSTDAAKSNYAKAIALKPKLGFLPDTVLFKPYVFIAELQYSTDQFDSAWVNYKKAEEIAAKYTTIPDGANRLYNDLGNMYSDMADYMQAKTYFEKAISLVSLTGDSAKKLLVNYRANLASILVKLEEFDEAGKIYSDLVKQDTSRQDILHQAGITSLQLGNGSTAIGFLRQVSYNDNNQVRLLNDIGHAYESIGYSDSARRYYMAAITENNKWLPGRKNVQAGLTLKYLGDLDTKVKSFNEALKKYQKAIIQFATDFNDPDIYKNPEQYSGVFAYSSLFNALIAKAAAFEKFYHRVNDTRKLEAALDAYRAAYHLAEDVEKTYHGDEARLFLEKIKHAVGNKPIDVSLLLYEQTGQENFLEEAYLFDQQNKAFTFSLNARENESSSGNDMLYDKASSLRSVITRLSLKAAQSIDSTAWQTINTSIRDNTALLVKIQDEIKKNPGYTEKHLVGNIPSLVKLQKKLDRNTAIISYHLAGNELLAFIITDKSFDFTRTPVTTGFFTALDSFKRSLHDFSASDGTVSTRLYRTLITPVQTRLSNCTRLLIIPGDELTYFPLEALRDRNGRYLIERFAVQYQYSTALLKNTMAGTDDMSTDSTRLMTSLWQADDKMTTFITQRLYHYLKKGITKDKALQKAKLDFLGNIAIDSRFKTPAYWAHLVYIGEYEPLHTLSIWWTLGSSAAVAIVIIFLANLESRRKRLKIQGIY